MNKLVGGISITNSMSQEAENDSNYQINSVDKELIAACLEGNALYQKKLFDRYASKMLSICRRYANDQEEAKEMMHDGFIRVFRYLAKFRQESSLETWITRVMINNSLSFLKSKYKKNLHNSIDDGEYILNEESMKIYTDEKFAVDSEVLVSLMQQLPLGYRTVLNLYVMEEYTHQQIADELGISEGTSKSQLFKAKRMLKQFIEKAMENGQL